MQERFDKKYGTRLIQQYRDYMQKATPAQKQLVQESLGETHGRDVMEKKFGSRLNMHPTDKGTQHFWDDGGKGKDGGIVAIEYKGGRARESIAQRQPGWTRETADKVSRGAKGYGKASPTEKRMAQDAKGAMERGDGIRKVVVKSHVTPSGVRTHVRLKEAVYAKNAGATPASDVKVTRDPHVMAPKLHKGATGGKTGGKWASQLSRSGGNAPLAKVGTPGLQAIWHTMRKP